MLKLKLVRLLFCSLYLGIGASNAQNFTLHGRVTSPTGNTVTFMLLRNGLLGDSEVIELPIGKEGAFKLTLQLQDVALVHFWEGERGSSIFLQDALIEPNDSIVMRYDSRQFWETLRFEGTGAPKYQYHAEDLRNYGTGLDRIKQQGDQITEPIAQLFAYLDSLAHLRAQLLQRYQSAMPLRTYQIYEAEKKAEIACHKLNLIYFQNEKDTTFNLFTMPLALKGFIQAMPRQNDTTAKSSFYLVYLEMLARLYFKEMHQLTGGVGSEAQWNHFQKAFYTPSIAQIQRAIDLYFKIRRSRNSDQINELISLFQKEYPESPYIAILSGKALKLGSLINGKTAPPFTVWNEQGKAVKLSDLKGKVVFVDFWANWCVACINQMKKFKPIYEQFKENPDFVYLTISMDEQEDTWRQSLSKWSVEGLRCWTKDAYGSDVAKAYQINQLPVYFLIGKDGHLLDANPPRPNFDEGKPLVSLIESALRKKE
jgi:thiol-disulfide isomerase/thioredoxin